MRQLRHPGPIAKLRTSVVADIPVHLNFALEPGDKVDQAIANGFAAAGCLGGFVEFASGQCDPFRFVIPAASRDGLHAAWYSEVFAPAGANEMIRCGATMGERDGKPFVHCHGMWKTSDGIQMGHMLAADCIVSESIAVTGIGFSNATFRAAYDSETNFTLFQPEGTAEPVSLSQPLALLVRVRPNEDICLAVESICRQHHIRHARILGIGSLNEVHFSDGRHMPSHATELLVREGRVVSGDDGVRASLDIVVVAIDGTILAGEIVRGDNPVCVTFELVIEALDVGRA